MNTAVQLRGVGPVDRPRGDLVYGVPRELADGQLGPVALFASDDLVAYRLQHRRRARLFVFRTLRVRDPLAALVPGVQPRVRLLFELRTAGRIRLARKLFGYLTQAGRPASALSDAFYLRIGAALSGRLPRRKILLALLERELAPRPIDEATVANSRSPDRSCAPAPLNAGSDFRSIIPGIGTNCPRAGTELDP